MDLAWIGIFKNYHPGAILGIFGGFLVSIIQKTLKFSNFGHNYLLDKWGLGCFPLHMFLTFFNVDQLELCMHVNIHKNQKLDLKCKTSSLAINFNYIKGIRKSYKGKHAIGPYLVLFEVGCLNWLAVFSRLPNFSCCIRKRP